MLPPELEMRLRTFCSRTRMYDFFKMFDKLTLKRIEPASAIRALDMAGFRMSPAEQEAVKAHYLDGHGQFNYGRFCVDWDEVKPSGYFERRPEEATSGAGDASGTSSRAFTCSPLDGGSAWFHAPPAGADEVTLYDSAMAKARKAVKERGLVLKTYYRMYDDRHRAAITVTRFQRETSSCLPTLTGPEIDVLARAYISEDGHDVRYMVFHNDATPVEISPAATAAAAALATSLSPLRATGGSTGSGRFGATGGAGASATASGTGILIPGAPAELFSHVKPCPDPRATLDFCSLPASDGTGIEASVVRQIYDRRIRAADLFADFDRTKRGVITRSQFMRGLRAAKLEGISPAALDTLANKYALTEDTTGQSIRWAVFAAEVEKAFTEPGLEKSPTKKLDSFARTVVTAPHPRAIRPTMEPEDAAAVQRALDAIIHRMKTYRIYSVKATLLSYDKAHEGMVTETQFLRVLAAVDLVPHRDDERRCLLDYFRGTGIKAHMIDYRAFLAAVDGAVP